MRGVSLIAACLVTVALGAVKTPAGGKEGEGYKQAGPMGKGRAWPDLSDAPGGISTFLRSRLLLC